MKQIEMPEPEFRLIFESCPHPYLVLLPDTAFTIIAVDNRYLAVTGTQRPSIIGRGLFEVFPDNPSDKTATGVSDLRTSLERVLRDRVPDVMGVQKYDIPREGSGNGFEVRYWSPVNTPVFGDDGSVAMIIHHVEDITDFVLARERASVDTAHRLDQAQARLARMEAEVLRRAAEVKAANRQIKAMMEEQERRSKQQREAELARMDERLGDIADAKTRLLTHVFHKIRVPQTSWGRYATGLSLFIVSLALRLLVLPADDGLAFITFYPATALIVPLCGFGPGLLSALLGAVFGYMAFMPPFWTLKFALTDLPVLAIYVGSSVLICVIIDQILRAAGSTSAINRQLSAMMEALQQDIGERKRTELALRHSEETFRSSFDHAAIGKALIGLDGRWIRFNPFLCTLMGYSEEELADLTLQDITHPQDLEKDQAEIRDLLDGRSVFYRVEKRYIRKDREIVWTVANVSLLRDRMEAPLHFILQFQDVTEQKRAEQKAQRLHRIIAMMSEGNQAVVRAEDEHALFLAMCRVVVEQGGYTMAWMGLAEHDDAKTIRPVAWAGHEAGYLDIAHISWGDGALGAGPTGMSVRTGLPQINNDFAANPAMSPWRQPALERGYRSSISLPLKDQSEVFGVLTLYAHEPDVFGAEEVKLLVELADDVAYGIIALRTRRDHDALEQTLFQAQKMECLGQLTGGVAHDFNNLLQVILSNLDLSLQTLGKSAAVAGYLQNAIAGAEQGAKLTGHLLAFARRQPLRPEPVRVDRLVRAMTNLLRRTIGETIDIELVTCGGLWTALVDSNQLQNAILNLAINARDAMPSGGRLMIELSNALLDGAYAATHREVKAGSYVMVAMTDTGTGMSAEILEKVFEPFFTTKPEGRGTGLGLSMVYGFVKQSGGHIKIYSEVGQGTTIKLYLPRTLKSAAPRVIEEARATRGNGESILVAEDDDGVRRSVVAQLSELGYRVLAVARGEAALDILKRGDKVDLLFTDVVMPGTLNGRALADQARQLRPDLAVVFTSGYTENAIIHHGRLDQGVTLLSKPYRLVQLADTIRNAMQPSPAVVTVAPSAEALPVETSTPPPIGKANSASAQGSLLLVEDEEMLREVLAESLERAGFRVVATNKPTEALRHLASDPTIQLLISDVGLSEMNGIALAREALARHPQLAVILTSGRHLDACDLPDPTIRTLLKPFRPQALIEAVDAELRA